MKTYISFFIFLILSINSGAQIITRFTWETNPVTTAAAGVNAISVSSYATVSANGATGNGLNPGAGSHDINLVFDSTAFNVPAIDISVDFRREESQAYFFTRNNFNFGMNGGAIAVNFQVYNGLTTATSVSSPSFYNVPNDHKFHNYHFNYDNNTGVAKVWVDTALVYTYTGTAGKALYWVGAGDVTVGKYMDGTGNNVAILDNLVVQQYASSLLPLQLLSFTAAAENKYAALKWNTTEELGVASYEVERSSNGAVFSAIKSVRAVNGYNTVNAYEFTDSLPSAPVSYYRLKMINNDGSFTYSDIKSINIATTSASEITLFPNPVVNYAIIKMSNAKAGQYHYIVSSVSGQVIIAADVQLNNGPQQITIDLSKTTLKGIMIVHLANSKENTAESFTIIKK